MIKLKKMMSKNQPKKKVVRQERIKHLLMIRGNKNLNYLMILKIQRKIQLSTKKKLLRMTKKSFLRIKIWH